MMNEYFSMIRDVEYYTPYLKEDMILRDMLASASCSMQDIPKYCPIKRGGFATNSYWQISEMKQGPTLDDLKTLSRECMPYRFRRYAPLCEKPIDTEYVILEHEKLTCIDTDNIPVSADYYKRLLEPWNKMFESIKQTCLKSEMPPNWGKING